MSKKIKLYATVLNVNIGADDCAGLQVRRDYLIDEETGKKQPLCGASFFHLTASNKPRGIEPDFIPDFYATCTRTELLSLFPGTEIELSMELADEKTEDLPARYEIKYFRICHLEQDQIYYLP